MKQVLKRVAVLVMAGVLAGVASGEESMQGIHAFTVQNIAGADVNLADYKGKVLLIVNVASRCGFTGQYEGLQALYAANEAAGLVVMGFPANNFMGQEPGNNSQIQEFCSTKFGVTFPMFAKISVKGDDQHPLYRYLTTAPDNPALAGDVSWNFNKFLIGRDGRVLARFGSKTAPDSAELAEAIASALAQP